MKTFLKVARLIHLAVMTLIATYFILGGDNNAIIAGLLASLLALIVYGRIE